MLCLTFFKPNRIITIPSATTPPTKRDSASALPLAKSASTSKKRASIYDILSAYSKSKPKAALPALGLALPTTNTAIAKTAL
jgi:hypothetical protein